MYFNVYNMYLLDFLQFVLLPRPVNQTLNLYICFHFASIDQRIDLRGEFWASMAPWHASKEILSPTRLSWRYTTKQREEYKLVYDKKIFDN